MNNFYVYIYSDFDNIPFYIGKGKDRRYTIHLHLQKHNTNSFFKNKIKKVGIDNIKIEFPLKNVSEVDAFAYEELFIGIVGRRDQGKGPLCNLTNGGEGDSGRVVSIEHRQKISKAQKGHIVSDETKRKMSGLRIPYGPMTESTKRKLSKALKGKPSSMKGKSHSDETKRKMSKVHTGKKLSKEIRKKMSKSHIGKKLGKETRKKISTALIGRPSPMKGKNHTKETKRKISESLQHKQKGKSL